MGVHLFSTTTLSRMEDTPISNTTAVFIHYLPPEQPVQSPVVQTNQPSAFHADLLANPRRDRPTRERKEGFGSNEADHLIIEAMERSEQKKGNIPPESFVHCTTDSTFLPNVDFFLRESRFSSDNYTKNGTDTDTSLFGQSNVRVHSYFRDPNVMRAIREQQHIETKEFSERNEDDRRIAENWIGPQWRNQQADLLDETFNRRHYRNEKNEARTRIREKEKSQHDLYRLKRRVEKLETMDATLFRGHTLAEQQKDRAEALKCAGELVNRYDREEVPSYDEDDYSDQAEYYNSKNEGKRANRVNGSRREKERVEREPLYDLAEDPAEFNQSKPRKRKHKKAPAPQVYVYDDPNNTLEDQYEDFSAYAQKKKQNRKPRAPNTADSVLGKRKRTVDSVIDGVVGDEDYMDYELDSGVNPHRSSHKKSIPTKPRGFPPPVKSEKNSKLLEAARKYNPNRTARDLNPFGAQMRTSSAPILSSEFTNFDIPLWLAPAVPKSSLEMESEDTPTRAHNNAEYEEDTNKEDQHQLEDEGEELAEDHRFNQEQQEYQPPPESKSNFDEDEDNDDGEQENPRQLAGQRLQQYTNQLDSSLSPLPDEEKEEKGHQRDDSGEEEGEEIS